MNSNKRDDQNECWQTQSDNEWKGQIGPLPRHLIFPL